MNRQQIKNRILAAMASVSPEYSKAVKELGVSMAGMGQAEESSWVGDFFNNLKDSVGDIANAGANYYLDKKRAEDDRKRAEEAAAAEARRIAAELEAEKLRIQNEQARVEIQREQMSLMKFAKDMEFSPLQKAGLAVAGVLTLGLFMGWFRK